MFFGGLTIATNGFSMVFDFATIAFNGFRWFRTIGQTMRWFWWIVVVYRHMKAIILGSETYSLPAVLTLLTAAIITNLSLSCRWYQLLADHVRLGNIESKAGHICKDWRGGHWQWGQLMHGTGFKLTESWGWDRSWNLRKSQNFLKHMDIVCRGNCRGCISVESNLLDCQLKHWNLWMQSNTIAIYEMLMQLSWYMYVASWHFLFVK